MVCIASQKSTGAFSRIETSEGEPFEKSALKDMLSWINPFLGSLKGAHQPSACRVLGILKAAK
jgi:hypothetical protein